MIPYRCIYQVVQTAYCTAQAMLSNANYSVPDISDNLLSALMHMVLDVVPVITTHDKIDQTRQHDGAIEHAAHVSHTK